MVHNLNNTCNNVLFLAPPWVHVGGWGEGCGVASGGFARRYLGLFPVRRYLDQCLVQGGQVLVTGRRPG